MKRSEINNQFKWDTTKILKGKTIKELKDETKINIDKLVSLKGKITDNIDNFKQYLDIYNDLTSSTTKLYTHAATTSDQDLSDNDNSKDLGEIRIYVSGLMENISFLSNELTNNVDKIEKFIPELKDEGKFDAYIANLKQSKDHLISDEAELLISKISPALNASTNTFTKYSNITMDFGYVIKNGEKIKHTINNYPTFSLDEDESVREQAYRGRIETISNSADTLATTLYESHLKSDILSKIYKYDSTFSKALSADFVSEDVFHNLIKVAKDNAHLIDRYLELYFKLFGLDKKPWNIRMPYKSDKKYSFEEAKEMVIKSLSPLGEEYVEIVKRLFKENYIDVYPTDNKRSGAYSMSSVDDAGLILLNWNNSLSDVFTLSHEIGHSLHSYYKNLVNKPSFASYTILEAEIASTLNEKLLANYLLENSNDDNEKINVLLNQIDTIVGTFFRQIGFADFEYQTHKKVNEGNVLTKEEFSQIYKDTNSIYSYSKFDIDEKLIKDQAYFGLIVPHFYGPFYVYKYSTGIATSIAIADKCSKENNWSPFFDFLKAGSQNLPLENIKLTGIDLADYETISNLPKELSRLIDTLEGIIA